MTENQTIFLDFKGAIASLTPQNKSIVKMAYYDWFNLASVHRFHHVMNNDKMDFNVIEKRFLSKLFVIVDEKPILDYNSEILGKYEKEVV